MTAIGFCTASIANARRALAIRPTPGDIFRSKKLIAGLRGKFPTADNNCRRQSNFAQFAEKKRRQSAVSAFSTPINLASQPTPKTKTNMSAINKATNAKRKFLSMPRSAIKPAAAAATRKPKQITAGRPRHISHAAAAGKHRQPDSAFTQI